MIKADVTYPDYFPSPLLSTNDRTRGTTFDRSSDRGGLAYQEKGFAFQPVEMVFSIVCSVAEAQMFESFYFHALNNGVKWFNLERLTPKGLIVRPVRFIDPYTFRAIKDDLFMYSSKIEVFSND